MEKIIKAIEEYFKEEPLQADYVEMDDTVVEKVEKTEEGYEALCTVFASLRYDVAAEAQVSIRFKVDEDGLYDVEFLAKNFYGLKEVA